MKIYCSLTDIDIAIIYVSLAKSQEIEEHLKEKAIPFVYINADSEHINSDIINIQTLDEFEDIVYKVTSKNPIYF